MMKAELSPCLLAVIICCFAVQLAAAAAANHPSTAGLRTPRKLLTKPGEIGADIGYCMIYCMSPSGQLLAVSTLLTFAMMWGTRGSAPTSNSKSWQQQQL
jgi:hypothetical protein